jgi:hypothetical protein
MTDIKPVNVNDDVWFYPLPKTLEFVVWVTGRDGQRVSTTFRVRKSKIHAYCKDRGIQSDT